VGDARAVAAGGGGGASDTFSLCLH